MKYQFVTSMHEPYWHRIGSIMIESWLKHWQDVDCTLVVYGEEFKKDYGEKVEWRSWEEYCLENYQNFAKKTKGPSVNFSKKGFAFLDAMEKTNAQRLIWVDADILFYKKVPLTEFDNLLPENKLVAFFDQYYMDRKKNLPEHYTNKNLRTSYGAESGFVILNPNHKNYKTYVENYKNFYVQEKNKLITHWYDSEIVVLAAREFLTEIQDLSDLRTTNKTQTPLNRSWLNEYFHHHKAKSKDIWSQEQFKKMCDL